MRWIAARHRCRRASGSRALAPDAFWENDLAQADAGAAKTCCCRISNCARELGAPDVRYLLVVDARETANRRLRGSKRSMPSLQALVGERRDHGLRSRRALRADVPRRSVRRQQRLPDRDAARSAAAALGRYAVSRRMCSSRSSQDVERARTLPPLTIDSAARHAARREPGNADLDSGATATSLRSSRSAACTDVAALTSVRGSRPATNVALLDMKEASEALVAATAHADAVEPGGRGGAADRRDRVRAARALARADACSRRWRSRR